MKALVAAGHEIGAHRYPHIIGAYERRHRGFG
jgi:hypothetical protein